MDHLVLAPHLKAEATSRFLRVTSNWVLTVSKDGDSRASLSNLCQCTTNLTVKKSFFLCLSGILYASVHANCLLSFYRASLTKVSLCLLYQLSPISIKCLYTLVRFLWSLLFSRLNHPNSLSHLFSCDRCSKHFNSIVPLCSCYSSLLRWAQHTQCGVTSAECRGRITSLKPIAVLFLVQCGMLLSSFLQSLPLLVQGELGGHQGPQGLHCRAASQTLGLQPVQMLGVVPPLR